MNNFSLHHAPIEGFNLIALKNKGNKMNQIPVFESLIVREKITAAVESLKLGCLGMGRYINQFEKALAGVCQLNPDKNKFCRSKYRSRCSALIAAIMDVGVGGEVI